MAKYSWPASKLDKQTMELLWLAKQETGITISELIKEACQLAYYRCRVRAAVLNSQSKGGDAK